MDTTLILAFATLGATTGILAGLFGIGGGMLLVPFFTFLFTAEGFASDHVVHIAIATSLATILFTSIASVVAHHLRGAVLWSVAAALTPGLLVGSWFGPKIAAALTTAVLSGLFAVFLAFAALQSLSRKKPKATRELPSWPGMVGAGTGIGTLSGMVGAGGGFITVPFMNWCNVPMHNAVATSAALGFPIALAGTLSNIYHGWSVPELPPYSLGYVYTPALLAVALASVATAPLGARLAHNLKGEALKRVFSLLLMVLSSYMLWKSLHS